MQNISLHIIGLKPYLSTAISAYLVQVAVYNFKTVVIAVLIAVFAETPTIYASSMPICILRVVKHSESVGKNLIYKLIGSVVVCQQNIRRVVYCAVAVYPFEHGVKVRKGLYAGNKLNPVFHGKKRLPL